MIHLDPITVSNIIEKTPYQIAGFLNTHVLSNKIPQYTANQPLFIMNDIVPRLSKYANDKCYVIELYNIIVAAYFEQKKSKRRKSEDFNEDVFTDLEAKKEILYRTAQALDNLYEAASRLMTGIGQPDTRMSRHV